LKDVLAMLAESLATGAVRVVDLTHTLSPRTPVIVLPERFKQSPGVSIETISRFDDAGPAWYWNILRFGEHTGTHFDAPGHWMTGRDIPDGLCDTIPPTRFVGPACVIDVAESVRADEDFLLEPTHIEAWEARHGRIPAGAWALLRTGWSARGDGPEFLNMRDDGAHSPGFSKAASELLAHERDVLGVGVETVGTDAGQAGGFDPPFPTHSVMHGAGKLGLASLCNLDLLPPTGSVVIAAPLKIKDGSGSPVRALALVPAGA